MNPMQRGAPSPYAATPGASAQAAARSINNNPQSMLELYDVMRGEIEILINENKNYRALRDDYQRKMEEQVNEMQQIEQQFVELDRKHRAIKESYEAEIRRLKGQQTGSASASAVCVAPQPLPGASTSLPAYLPGPILTGPPPPTLAPPPGPANGARLPPPAPTVANPAAQQPPPAGPPQGASHLVGITSLVPPNQPRESALKKEATRASGATFPPSQQEDDYVVLKGRTAANTPVNMKVGLQNSLQHNSVVCCVRYSWDGQYLATGSNRAAQVYDVSTGRPLAKFPKEDVPQLEDGSKADSYVRAVCFSPNGQWLVTGAEDHVVKVWDVRRRTVKHQLVGHDTDIYSVDVSANSRFIVSGSGDKKAKLWNLETGALLATLGEEFGPTDGITSVCVSPTSQLVAAGSLDKVVRVWDVETNRLVRELQGHRDSVYSVAFSPDGRMLLSGSLDKTLKLWDLTAQNPSSQCRLSFAGHKDFVLSVAFCPSGRFVISGSKDRTVQFWDPRHSTMALQLQGHRNSVISIAHNPRSQSLATGSGDCRARTWTYS